MNKECDIVKDLLFSNLEDDLSDSSKDFIKEHIKNCNDCKRILEELKKEKEENKKEETKENVKKIEYLKRYNKKIKLLKSILIILVISIIITCAVMTKNYFKNKADYEYKYSIITAINRPAVQMDRNFKCHIEKTSDSKYEEIDLCYNMDRVKYSYEEKYKEENMKRLDTDYVGYGIILEPYKMYTIEFNKEGELRSTSTSGYLEWKSMSYNDMINYIITGSININNDWNSISKENCAELNIEEDNYEGKDCYVIKKYKKDGGYFEVWIEKESMLVLKINEDEDYVVKFSWEIGTVTDEDLKIENYEVAKKKFEEHYLLIGSNELTDSLKKLFE